jgi:hypothetical protein
VLGYIILGMTQTWSKYTYVCSTCDSLIEFTCPDAFQPVTNITCPCNNSTVLLSVEDATIQPTTTKEEQMETTENVVPDTYNSNLLVTYKKIHGFSNPEYITDKVVNIEWELHNGRQSSKTVGVLQDKINTVKTIILEAYADSEDQETLQAIAEALDIELTKDVEFTATIEVSGTITLNLLEDYDLESEITDALYVDAQNGNIVIDEQEVCHVREAY